MREILQVLLEFRRKYFSPQANYHCLVVITKRVLIRLGRENKFKSVEMQNKVQCGK